MLGGCGCTRFLRSTGLDCYSARNLMLLVVAVAYSRRAPVFLHSDPAPLGPTAGRARNSMHATAKCSRARGYSTGGRDREMAASDHDLWIEAGSARCRVSLAVSPEVGRPDLESTSNDDDKARTTGSSDEKRRRPRIKDGRSLETDTADARPCHLAASSSEKEAEGSWCIHTHTHTDGRPKKERKRKENKNIKRKRGKKRIKNKSKEKERKKEPEKMHPLNTVEASAG